MRLASVILVLMLGSCAARERAESRQSIATMPEYLVGVYYFSGWWPEPPNKYGLPGRDWRVEYPGRVALLGEYNDRQTMEREIDAAAAGGVSFFQFLWYYQGNVTREPHQAKLNAGLGHFLASPNSGRLWFTIEYTNHPPFQIASDDAWQRTCREWAGYMRHPRYLRLDGRPVFKIHGLHHFLNETGRDRTAAAERLVTLRRISVESGAGDPLIGAGVGVAGMPTAADTAGIDFLTVYMDIPPLPQRGPLYPYTDLLNWARHGWRQAAEHSPVPYVPYVPAGWDPRPWGDPRPSFTPPSRDEWAGALRSVREALDHHESFGLPLRGGGRQKTLLIYAWNEFGEGGILAPTRSNGGMMVDTVSRTFAADRRRATR